MKNYNCPYCKFELSTDWDELLIKNYVIYNTDFLICSDCKKEYKLLVIRDRYLQVVGLTKHEYAQEIYSQKALNKQYNLELKDKPNRPRPEKYKTYLRCISKTSLNQEFELTKVSEIAESTPALALSQAYDRVARNIFNKYKDLKKIVLLSYVIMVDNVPLFSIQTIRNKPYTTRVTHGGFTMFNHSHTSPVTYDEEIIIEIARQEAPFLFPEYRNLGFQALNV